MGRASVRLPRLRQPANPDIDRLVVLDELQTDMIIVAAVARENGTCDHLDAV
jgi:hypothetical protein